MATKISTFIRFVYLNSYAYLLFIVGIGITFIPVYQIHWLLLIVQSLLVIGLVGSALKIFLRWNQKKRSYTILIERNKNAIRIDTFAEYMQAPCGRLLVRIVLKDLNKQSLYKILKRKYVPTFHDILKRFKESRKPKRTIIHIEEQ